MKWEIAECVVFILLSLILAKFEHLFETSRNLPCKEISSILCNPINNCKKTKISIRNFQKTKS